MSKTFSFNGLNEFREYKKEISTIASLYGKGATQRKFGAFICDKLVELAREIAEEELGTDYDDTNSKYYQTYIDGFKAYFNHDTGSITLRNTTNVYVYQDDALHSFKTYPQGLDLALLFEYGTGLSSSTPSNSNWQIGYHIHSQWIYPDYDGTGEEPTKEEVKRWMCILQKYYNYKPQGKGQGLGVPYSITKGFEGYGIFGKIRYEVEDRMQDWLQEFFEELGVEI